ncbi:MAG: arsenate reductase [Deltaproteobacteria bacterium]|nr:MAG: arsenate reductase [Deltaproteobacteria bacterium]
MSKEKVKIYVKPTCTTCRKALRILKDRGVDFEVIDYYRKPLTVEKLRQLLKKLGLSPGDILRKSGEMYKRLGLSKGDLSDSEVLDLMLKYPDLIQRPIVEKGNKAILARPVEKIYELL